MHFVVLANADSWCACRDLARAAAGRHAITVLNFRELASDLGGERLRIRAGEFDVSQADAVLVRTMPPGSLEQVVFRMDLLARLDAAGTPVINPPKALEAAVDKYLASTLLAAAGLTTPDTIVCQTADQAMEGFAQLGGDVVLKPLFGSEGRGIARLEDEALALRAFKLFEDGWRQRRTHTSNVSFSTKVADLRLLRITGERGAGHAAAQSARLAHEYQPRRDGRAVRTRSRVDRDGATCGRGDRSAGGWRRPVACPRRPDVYH